MPVNKLSFRIGGEAGQGVESSGSGFVKALTRGGLHALGIPDYYSRIRGGHNHFTVRVDDKPVLALRETIELLLALNAETIARHIDSLVPGGGIIVDEATHFDEQLTKDRDVRVYRAPMMQIAEQEGSSVMANTAALAVAAGLTGYDLQHILGVVDDNFRRKGDAIVQANRRVAQAAYDLAGERFKGAFRWKLEARELPPRMTLTGNQAFAMGALMAGCKFAAGYPMTPATPVLEYLTQHAAQWGLVTKQAESEVAAINMVVGAAHAGVRAMAPTSGGGFDLMTEGLSLAAMTETPVVIYLAQRPGPATGLPTRTAQADLLLALHTSHGEFMRIVLAPHTAQEFFWSAVRAFNLAEKYQCTVIVLSDHYCANLIQPANLEDFDFRAIQIDRGKLLGPEEVDALPEYKRYALTPDGISPRAIPASSPNAVYLTSGDMHREDGHFTEDPEITTAMVSKLVGKADLAREEMRPPLVEGPEDAEITFVSWGSSYGPVHEAMEILNERGIAANMAHFVDLWPFPADKARQALSGARRLVDVEGNAMAQFAFLLRAHAGIEVDQKILRFDGRGFTPDYILGRLEVR